MRTDRKERIAIALSGGVDSAVVAALLVEQGHDVFALTMKLRPQDDPSDAAAVAQKLGIDHHVIDLVSLFRREVMEPFAQSYASGETPLPCALCNKFVKFGALAAAAKERGAEALATGHYARRFVAADGKAELHKGADVRKDQSYFLFALDQAQIDFVRFPLGEIDKDETRRLAQAHGLAVAEKKDSQDICFVPDGDYASVVRAMRPDAFRCGDIVDERGHVLGRHQGTLHYTIGQRKGLNLSARTGDHNDPLFVLSVDPTQDRVVVGPRAALIRQGVILKDLNWLGEEADKDRACAEGLPVEVRLRSTQSPVPALLFLLENRKAFVELKEPVYGIAAGQAGVCYVGSRLIAGGWIAREQACE